MEEKKNLPEKELEKVTGGSDVEIKVKIKTLDGDNDDYKIPLSESKIVRP